MGNIIVSIIILSIIVTASVYIINAKRKGVKCVGCPHGGSTDPKNNSCSCSSNDLTNIQS